jgi:glutaminase
MLAVQSLQPEPESTASDPALVAMYLTDLLERHASLDQGAVATYIPELATIDPSLFGISLATADGALYEAGDTRAAFTLQSMSKPLTYGLALELLGEDAIRRRIGVEPSGDAFNEISLTADTGAPVNPMINAGAIACAGFIASHADDPLGLLLDVYSRYVGRPVEIDEAVYRSESETGHRNRAIAHLLRNFDVITDAADAAVELYFRQCSVLVDCRDLATIAATLANGGVNPRTGERAVGEEVVRCVLSVMTTCGMYDAAGEWLVEVGLPAKSGVSGGVLAVLPGRLGIGVFSPPLDQQGNSVRGVAVCRDLSRDLGLHLVRPGERPAPPLRTSYTVADRRSLRRRREAERHAIRAGAAATAIFEIQGELGFAAGEAITRELERRSTPVKLAVLDLRRVLRTDPGGVRILEALCDRLDAAGGAVAVASPEVLVRAAPELAARLLCFPDLDLALEWCEDELLRRLGLEHALSEVALAEHQLLAGLSAAELERVGPDLGLVTVDPGTVLVRRGDQAREIFLVTHGSLSVVPDGELGTERRLATLSAGMTFGEMAYVAGGVRTAGVRADSDVQCRTLRYETLDGYREHEPVLHAKLLRNLLSIVVASLEVSNAGPAQPGR